MTTEREPKDSLRILIQSPYPLRRNRPDGVTNFILELKPHLVDKGCVVTLIGPDIKDKQNNAADYTLGRPVGISLNKTAFEVAVSFNKALAQKLFSTLKPDLIVLHEPLAGHAAHTLISAAPRREDGGLYPCSIGHFHARLESLDRLNQVALVIGKVLLRRVRFTRYGIPKGLTPGYIKTVMGELDGRIAVSCATASFWNEIYPGEYRVIYNGINVGELTPDGPKIDSWQDGKQTILFAGRHDERKGIGDLIKAFALVCNQRGEVKLKITGEGEMTSRLKRMVNQMQLPDVEFTGILSRQELIKAYRTANVFVSPATGGEGFGRTLAESLSCGTLVVGTDIDGYREVIGGQPFARMAKPENPEDLARKILEILNLPPELRETLGREARKYAENRFSWSIIAYQTVKYYEECLSLHGSRNEIR